MSQRHRYPGQLLIEILLAVALLALLLPAVLGGLISASQSAVLTQRYREGLSLAHEQDEALRVIRAAGWSNVAGAGMYHVRQTATTWQLLPGPETQGAYTRSIVISDVQRDPQGVIVPSGALVDPATKKIVSTISWSGPQPGEIRHETYLTNYLDPLAVSTPSAPSASP